MKPIGENALIAFLAAMVTLGVVAWQVPEELAGMGIVVVSLFSILLGRKKEEKVG